MSDTRAIARRAGELIGEHGWIRGRLGNRAMGFCLLGACAHAMLEHQEVWTEMSPIMFALRATVAPDVPVTSPDDIQWRVIAWNDDDRRTKQDVLDLLDRIAGS